MTVRVGTAGWAIPRLHASLFPGEGSQLERYAQVLPVVEINSTFKHEHRADTFTRWAHSTPDGFRFSLKLPKIITHDHRLRGSRRLLLSFLAGARVLGIKLGPILVQLPPSLGFEFEVANRFFRMLRSEHPGAIVCEPRNDTWFTDKALDCLVRHQVSRVAADPPTPSGAEVPGGWEGLTYYRLHGAPRKYFSAYTEEFIADLARKLTRPGEVWCIFDNTAHGAAAGDAMKLIAAVPATVRPAFYRPARYALVSSA